MTRMLDIYSNHIAGVSGNGIHGGRADWIDQ